MRERAPWCLCVLVLCLPPASGRPARAQSATAPATEPGMGAALGPLLARPLPRRDRGGHVWEYTLVISERLHRLADGTSYKVWAFGGTVPGPTLVAREGDRVRITLVNETSTGHSLHSHGLWVPHRMDGAPHAHAAGPPGAHADHAGHHQAAPPAWTQPVPAGGSYVYDYIARPAGSHFYHCHVNTNEHLDRGMSGALIVLPRRPEPRVDRDLVFLLDEWDTAMADTGVPGHPRRNADYDMFTINGRSFPETETTTIALGEVVRVRFINAGAQAHSMHLHGHEFLVTHKDGQPLAEPALMDTVAVAPGERVDIVFVANNPGDWPLHCHTAAHVTNRGRYPGGMMAHFVVGNERYPRTGEGPVRPGIRALRQQWSAAARKALADKSSF